MTSLLTFAILLFAFGISATVHEFAHAYEMRKRGVKINSIGIGVPVKWLTIKTYSKYFDCPVTFSPLVVMAYVKPEKSNIWEEISLKDNVVISGSGPWANYCLGLVLGMILSILYGFFIPHLWMLLFALGMVLLAKRFFSYVIMPVLAILGLLAVIAMTGDAISADLAANSIGNGLKGAVDGGSATGDVFGGPIAIFNMTNGTVNGFVDFLSLTMTLTLAIGLLNTLPLFPLDGGRIVGAYIKNISPTINKAFENIGVILVVLLVVLSLGNDIISLF
ncbi:MAG: site-2 protease family protein [Candidatus Komeilibacteria bacterium]